MVYSFDPNKAKQTFDQMFGAGAYDKGIAQAASTGRQIGELKLKQKQREEQQRLLEAAAKEAAKKEKARQKKADAEKAAGRKETVLSKQIDDKKFRLKQAGVDSSKPQSAVGKALNLNPDNNALFDAFDLMSRGINGVSNIEKNIVERGKKIKKARADGKLTDAQYSKAILDQFTHLGPDFMAGLKGHEKTFGSDTLAAAGMKKGVGRAVAGFGLDVAQDPLNVVGGVIGKGVGMGAKVIGKGLAKIPGAEKVIEPLDTLFRGKIAKQKTLSGGKSNDLLDLQRQMENNRLYMHDKSKTDIAKAILQGGAGNGVRAGKIMEDPLIRPKGLDLGVAPNVLNPQAALDLMNPALKATTAGITKPISHIGEVSFKTLDQPLENGITPSLQQKLDWGRKGLLNDKIDLGAAGTYVTKGNKVDLGPYGTWGGDKIATEASRFLTSGASIEKAAEVMRYHPKIQQAAQTLINSNADLRNFATQNGLDIKDLEGYMAHFVTKEARKHLDETGQVVSDGTAAIGGNKKVTQRELHDSVRNANVKMEKATGVKQFFNPDAYVATAGGQQRMINYVVHEATKRQILDNPDFARVLNHGTKARKGMIERTIDGNRYELTKGANQVLVNFERHVNDEGVNIILKGFDKLQNLWKKTALFSTGFHARNALGNTWNMYVSGMNAKDVVMYQAEALHALEGIHARAVGRSTEGAKAIDKTYQEFLQNGLKNTGSTADFAKNAEASLMHDIRYKTKGTGGKIIHPYTEIKNAEGVWGKTKAALDAPFEMSKQLGDNADEVSRFALFKWARDKGMSPAEAADKVREVLFDYTALTEAERKVFKRMAPFYTWTRKNAEFQIKSFMKHPEKYNRLNIATQEGYKNTNMDQNITPDYLKNSMALPIPGTNRMLSANLPASDLNQLLDPGKMALDSLTPLMKVPLELAMNQQTLNGAPIQQFNGQTENIPGVGNVPVKTAYALKNLISPVRNLSGAKQLQNDGGNPLDILAKMTGGDLAKKWNQDSFQKQADWKENDRLQQLITKTEKQDGKDVQTVNELKKQGVYRDPADAQAADTIAKSGLNKKQVDMMMALRKKVQNGNAQNAAKVAQLLQRLKVSQSVIDVVTSDYLNY